MSARSLAALADQPTDQLDWQADAACAGQDNHIWFPTSGGEHAHTAKKICQTCPVITNCYDYAMTEDIRHGVWAGLSERERRTIRRQRHRHTIPINGPLRTRTP